MAAGVVTAGAQQPEATTPSPGSPILRPATPPAAGALRETVVSARVKSAIVSDHGMKGSDISVDTEDGVVTLSGVARSEAQVTTALHLAQRQQGVRRVVNQIEVR